MRRIRVIPVLLLQKGRVVKSVKFGNHTYVGDPMNAVRIFNEKEIDEIIILDIDASREGRGPDMAGIRGIAEEAFIPLAYGGGINSIEQVGDMFYNGVEKVIFNTQAIHNPDLITETARMVGSQSVVVSIDIKKDWLGRTSVWAMNGSKKTGLDPVAFAKKMVNAGAGEIFLNDIDRDGTFSGYNTRVIGEVSRAVPVPVIACGGAADLEDFVQAVKSGASAVAAGSMFVFQRPHKAVLISYPSAGDLNTKFFNRI